MSKVLPLLLGQRMKTWRCWRVLIARAGVPYLDKMIGSVRKLAYIISGAREAEFGAMPSRQDPWMLKR